MTATAVTGHVDDDILVESLAEIQSQCSHADYGLGVITIDMEDRDLQALGQIGWVAR